MIQMEMIKVQSIITIQKMETIHLLAVIQKNGCRKESSMLAHLEFGITANIEVHGNTLVNAGDMIDFNLPTQTAAKTEKGERLDFFFNGKFLIKKIRHDFDFGEMRHEMVLSIVRDDLAVELEDVAESHEYENKPEQRWTQKIFINK